MKQPVARVRRAPPAATVVTLACAAALAPWLAAPALAQSRDTPGAEVVVPPLPAQTTHPPFVRAIPSTPAPMALSFEQAAALQRDGSPALAGRDDALRAGEAHARAVRHVGGPVVSLSANYLRYQKTLSVDLAGARRDAQGRIDD